MDFKFKINAEEYLGVETLLDNDGNLVPIIHSSVYIGDEAEPTHMQDLAFEKAIDEYIYRNSIPSNPPSLKAEYLNQLINGLDSMIAILEKKKQQVHDMPRIDV